MWKSRVCRFYTLFMVALFCLIVSKPCSPQDKPEEFIEPYELVKEETFYSKGLFLLLSNFWKRGKGYNLPRF